jgi:fimbrial chaperone protein
MPAHRPCLWVFLGACLCLMLCRPGQAWASSFEVSPIRLSLSASATSGLLTVQNQSSETERLEVSAFAWSQSPTGEMQLAPTQDIVFFPAMLSLKPGETRNVRIGSVAPSGPTEKTYRVFVEELPPPVNLASPNAIRVLTRMAIPIFQEPTAGTAKPRIDGLALNHGKVSFSLANDGSAHFVALKVRVTGTDAAGAPAFDHELPAWYVLAGGVRTYELLLAASECRASHLVVAIDTDKGSRTASIDPSIVSCSP